VHAVSRLDNAVLMYPVHVWEACGQLAVVHLIHVCCSLGGLAVLQHGAVSVTCIVCTHIDWQW
jgi:hypothetical protein